VSIGCTVWLGPVGRLPALSMEFAKSGGSPEAYADTSAEALTAASMRVTTSSGWETIAT
jgi:hypothetical protein